MYGNIMDTIGFVQNADPEVGEAMNKELLLNKARLEATLEESLLDGKKPAKKKVCVFCQLRHYYICTGSTN